MSSTLSKLPFLEVIEWIEQDPNLVMWKVPDGDREIKNGAKLIVRESQSAMFMNEGNIADIFANGTHVLSTANIPLLTRLKGWKHGFESPFKADVYYFSVKQFVNLKWGTPTPVILRDAQFGQVRLRAFGSYNLRITDEARFFREYAGTFPQLTIFEIEQQLRDYIAPKFGEALAQSGIPLLDIAGSHTVLNGKIEPLIQPYFENLGIEISQFTVTSVTLPEEVNQYYDKVTGMNMVGDMAKFQQFNTAIAVSQEGNPAQQGAQQGVAMGMVLGGMANAQQQPATAAQPQAQAQPQAAAQPVAPVAADDDITAKLQKIKQLFDAGLIEEDEFRSKKSELLARL